jgi:outer membrane autotransporter protein
MTSSALLGRCVRLFAFAAMAMLAQPALATINCEITPDSVTTLIANTGDNLSVGYTVGGGGCGTAITTTTSIITDTTGGNVNPPSETNLPGSRNSFINVGSAAGTMVVRIECTAGCFGSPANLIIDYTVTATVPVIRNLSPVGPLSFTAEDGSSRTIQVVADDSGVPAGTTILWSATGPVTLSSTSTNTDGAGIGTVVATFGPGTGTATISANRVDRSDFFVDYTVTVQPPVVRTLASVGGGGQVGPTRQALASPLTIEARDSGTPTPGIGINWSIVSGDATLVSPTNTTDTAGRAQTGVLFGPTAGPVVVRASRTDEPTASVDFTVTSTLSRSAVRVSGDGQSAPVRSAVPQPLVFEARDNNLPYTGIGVAWSVVSGDATLVSPTTTTDATGRVQTGVLFGATPGTVIVRAQRTDDASIRLDYTLTSTLVRTILPVSGSNQNAPTRTALPNPLIVETRDNGAPAPGIGLVWSVVSGDATLVGPQSTTDGAGRAQTGLQFGATPGTVVVRAARTDDAQVTVDFTLTSTFVRTLALVSGGNQQGLPGLPLPNPIVIEVRGNGQPEQGVVVDIRVDGDATVAGDGGASAKITKVTGADGRVSAVVTLGPTSNGVVSIQASVPSTPGLSTTVAATANNLENLPGLTGPERELGGVIQDACAAIARIPVAQRTAEQSDLLARCQSFAGANPGQIADALDQLLPDTTLAMVNVALQAGQAQLDNLKARIAALRSGTQGSAFGGLALASPAGAIPVTSFVGKALNADETIEAGAGFDRWGYFVSGTIGRGESEAGRRTPAYDFDINGLTAGVDYRFSDGFVGGASLGYTKQDTELASGEGNVDADGYSLSAYATFYRDESWYTDAVLTWGRNDYETLRRIRYTLTGPGGTSTIDQTARGRLDGDLLSVASTVGRDYQAGTWNIGPYGRMLYSRIDFDAGREVIGSGAGSGLALEIFPGTHTSLASVIGTKFSTALSRDWGILMPHLQVEWEHEYRDDPQRVGARFLADPSATRFSIEGEPIDSSFFRIGGGLSVLFAGGRSGFVYVERVIGKSGFTQTNLALGIRGEF